jgi:hypothetical protein
MPSCWAPQPGMMTYGWMVVSSEICGQWRDDLSKHADFEQF